LRQFFGPPRRKRGCLFPIVLTLFLLLLARVAWLPLLTACGGFLIENDGARKADAIVVLGGDHYGDRVVKGAELAKAGYAPVVYVSGPPRLMGFESADEVQFAEKAGYPAGLFQELHLPGEEESTRTESQFIGEYLAQHGIKSILLVTSNFHTKRAAKLWRQENPKLQITVVPSPTPFFTPDTWWKTRPGQKIFTYEWMKTLSVMAGI